MNKNEVHIYIPTYRRSHLQRTLERLPTSVMRRTTLVCDQHDEPLLQPYVDDRGCDLWIVPKSIKTIAQKRAWIINNTPYRKIVMMDDDLMFCRRKYGANGDFTIPYLNRKQVRPLIDWLDEALQKYAHVGVGARQANHNTPGRGVRLNGRCMYVLGYDVTTMRKVCKLGRIEHREDMDYTLQLFKAGYKNAVSIDFSIQHAYNNMGGARTDRTVEASNADAEKLARLHKPFVKVVDKQYRSTTPRKEVIVYWRKAYDAAPKKRKLKH